MTWRTFWLGVVGVVIGLVIVIGVLVVVPVMIYPPLPDADLLRVPEVQTRIGLQQSQGQLQNTARSTLLQVFAGLLLVVGAAATWRQVQVNRDGQITDRFSRAVEQIANDNLEVRTGGLYVLERVSKDSPKDRLSVQVTIGSFVHNRSPWPVGSPGGPEHPTQVVDGKLPWLRMRAPDVQTAMAILARRPEPSDALVLRLSRVDLRSVQLENQQLKGVDLRWSNLARAWLGGTCLDRCDCYATDFRKANLRNASFRKASLRNAFLQGADLRGADLEGADLRGAHADATTRWPSGFTPEVLRERGVIDSAAQPPSD